MNNEEYEKMANERRQMKILKRVCLQYRGGIRKFFACEGFICQLYEVNGVFNPCVVIAGSDGVGDRYVPIKTVTPESILEAVRERIVCDIMTC